jgi:hypothetical protein
MSKFCANGHQMDDTWTVCPYCQKTGFEGAGLGKTRMEGVPSAGGEPGAAAVRKTVVLGEKPKGAVVGWFVAMNGNQMGQDFRVLEGQQVLGSAADCDIILDEPSVTAHHASLRHKDGKFVLTDLDSTNGTFINEGATTIAREEIKDNDLIRLGKLSLKFKCL